ncbi:SMI1/KNR4 family protein [Pyxidicoccus caerfyrddinensis]|uniref:SMI1/KNR4 family protein n=1 Tax=Pyxidicoccus caerfyrddinensis TaxID=2709663 RepID=UPI0013DB420F|nr:SMI1/KNR4 family protein [Pyxidicoccus caerfyrddinensis]
MTMEQMLAEISRAHFPRPPATPEQIAAFEAQAGWRLDAELRAFYLHCNGAELFRPLPDANYSILSLADIQRKTERVRFRDKGAPPAASWFPLVDCQDSDFVLVDTSRPGSPYPLLDAYHETYPREARQIAATFGEFLERALSSGDQIFWLNE